MRKQAAIRQADILQVLRASASPLTAYQVLEELQTSEPEIAPPTVYRALNALTEQGKAHRLESLKAFVPCRCDHRQTLQVLSICDDCGTVEEHDGNALLPGLEQLAKQNDFGATKHTLEIRGRCAACTSLSRHQ